MKSGQLEYVFWRAIGVGVVLPVVVEIPLYSQSIERLKLVALTVNASKCIHVYSGLLFFSFQNGFRIYFFFFQLPAALWYSSFEEALP